MTTINPIQWAIDHRRCVVCGDPVKGRRRCCSECKQHWRYCHQCKRPQPIKLFYGASDHRCIACRVGHSVDEGYAPKTHVRARAQREQEIRQIERLLAIELSWQEIAERLGQKKQNVMNRYCKWHRKREKKAST